MMNNSVKILLQTLEEELLKPEVRQSEERLNQLLADDFQEIGSSGRLFDKQDVLDRLPSEKPPKMILSNFSGRELAKDVALTTYSVHHQDKEKYTLRSSIWKKDTSGWRMTFHQGTITSKP